MLNKLRRGLFILDREGATMISWSFWTAVITMVIGTPTVSFFLDSIVQGTLVCIITCILIFLLSLFVTTGANTLLKYWPYDISAEEAEFERGYKPHIPYDE